MFIYLDKVYYDEKKKPIQVNLICDMCGNTIKIKGLSIFQSISPDKCVLKKGAIIRCRCGNTQEDYESPITFKRIERYEDIIVNKKSETSTVSQVRCPKCGSTQIQMVPRKWSLMTGFLTNKVDRVCVNCKHKF